MEKCHKGVDGKIMNLFSSATVNEDFFLYVSNKVTLEHALAVIGILTPIFFEKDGCVFWENSVTKQYKKGENTYYFDGKNRKEIERYCNIFVSAGLFQKWEEKYDQSIPDEERYKNDIRLSLAFAQAIEKYWRIALKDCFPNKNFEFEISENGIEDEEGVCLTFWQKI